MEKPYAQKHSNVQNNPEKERFYVQNSKYLGLHIFWLYKRRVDKSKSNKKKKKSQIFSQYGIYNEWSVKVNLSFREDYAHFFYFGKTITKIPIKSNTPHANSCNLQILLLSQCEKNVLLFLQKK